MKYLFAGRLLSLIIAAVALAAAGCGGGGGGGGISGSGGNGGNPPTTTTVTLRGRVNVPPLADPSFFTSRAAGKAGPYEEGYIPLVGAAVTAEGTTSTATTDSNGAFTLTITYTGSTADYPIKVSIVKNQIVLKKYVIESTKHLPFQVTPQTTAAALAYDRLTGQGSTGLDIDEMEYSAYKYTSMPIANIASVISTKLSSGDVVNLTSPLTEQGDVLTAVNVLTDIAAPALSSVGLSASTVNGGDSVKVTVWAEESTGMSNYSYLYLYMEHSRITQAYLEDWQYDTSSELWHTSATLDIPDYAATGTCYFSLRLTDTLSNYRYLYSSQDHYHIPSSDYQYETTTKLPSLTIASSSPDTTDPLLVSVEVTDGTIDSAGDTATLRFTVQETGSGMSEIYVRLEDDSGSYSLGGSCFSFATGTQQGEYTCDVTFQDTHFEATGTYTIEYISLSDVAGNYKSYYSGDIPGSPSISVTYAELSDPGSFSVSNASFTPASPSPGHEVELNFTLTADNKPSSIYVTYTPDGQIASWSEYQRFYLNTDDDSETGPWAFSGSATLGAYMATGTYKPYRIDLSSYSSTGSWHKRYQRDNDGDADFLDSFPSIDISTNSLSDADAPDFTTFQFESTSFVRGGQFKATMTVTDSGFPSYIYVRLRHETSTEPNAYYNIRCYNSFPGTTAGQWTFEMDETLPGNLEPGSWQVHSVSTYDLAGNSEYHNVSDTTFTLY